MDRFGRKVGMTYASICGAIGAIGCCGSQNLVMFVVSRFFAGAGAWSVLCVGKFNLSERSQFHA
jgi:MFS family permease